MIARIPFWLLTTVLLTSVTDSDAQQQGKVYRIGFMSIRSEVGPWDDAFKQGMREFGYVEGKNILFEYRWANGNFDRFPKLAANLAQLKVDLIVTETTPAAQAAKHATQTIPIVMAIGGDAVGAGLVASLSHPGGNVTGETFIGTDLAPKWVEIFKELRPKAARLGFLATSAIAPEVAFFKVMEPVAKELGMSITFFDMKNFKYFAAAFDMMKKSRLDGFIAAPNGGFRENRKLIAKLAVDARLPALYGSREFVESGGLSSYGQDVSTMFHRAAYFVHRIVMGAKPAELPVERPARYELLFNLITAKQIGLTIPPNLLVRADRVIR